VSPASERLDALVATLFGQIRLHNLAVANSAPDEANVKAFARKRVVPLAALLEAGHHVGLTLPVPEQLPYLYSTADWPGDSPPAGRLANREVPPHTALRALIGFWLLQCHRGGGADRLTRGMLWTLHRHGYRDALAFVFDAIVSGAIIDSVTGIEVLNRLLLARRQAPSDDRIFESFARTVPRSPAQWRTFDVSRPLFAPRMARPELTDDIDWLQSRAAERIAACRASRDAGEWSFGLAEIGPLCAILSRSFRELGLDRDLAYGVFTAQVEEIQADCGAYFLCIDFSSEFTDADRLHTRWIMAEAMEKMSRFHGGDWLERILEERVLVPDALYDLYWEDPQTLTDRTPPQWRAPAAPLRAALADTSADNATYPLIPVGTGFRPMSREALRGEVAQRGVEMDDEEIETVHSILERAYSGDVQSYVVASEIPRIDNLAVPAVTIKLLADRVRLEEHELGSWLREVYEAIQAAAGLEALRALIVGQPAAVASLADYVQAYPNFAHGHAERAIELDLAGQPAQAWDHIATAIAISPDEDTFWQSAGVILGRLRDDSGALLAKFMAEYLSSRSG
jgi:hypothetical protein